MNYIKRDTEGIFIGGENVSVRTGLNGYLNACCIRYLSTLEGRRSAAKKILNRTHLIPIYVDPDTLLIPTGAWRQPDLVLINVHQVTHVQSDEYGSTVWFFDGSHCAISLSISRFRRLCKLASELIRLMEEDQTKRKCLHSCARDGFLSEFPV